MCTEHVFHPRAVMFSGVNLCTHGHLARLQLQEFLEISLKFSEPSLGENPIFQMAEVIMVSRRVLRMSVVGKKRTFSVRVVDF